MRTCRPPTPPYVQTRIRRFLKRCSESCIWPFRFDRPGGVRLGIRPRPSSHRHPVLGAFLFDIRQFCLSCLPGDSALPLSIGNGVLWPLLTSCGSLSPRLPNSIYHRPQDLPWYHTSLSLCVSAHRIYSLSTTDSKGRTPSLSGIGVSRTVTQADCLTCDFCSSEQSFARAFFQISLPKAPGHSEDRLAPPWLSLPHSRCRGEVWTFTLKRRAPQGARGYGQMSALPSCSLAKLQGSISAIPMLWPVKKSMSVLNATQRSDVSLLLMTGSPIPILTLPSSTCVVHYPVTSCLRLGPVLSS